MKAIKWLAIVVAFESLISVMGDRHARRGVGPEEDWLVITTAAADGSTHDTIVAGVESEGRLYVAANHWPRSGYERAYVASPVSGTERDRIAAPRP